MLRRSAGQRTYAAAKGRRSSQQRIMNKGYKMQSYKAILSALALSVAGSVLMVDQDGTGTASGWAHIVTVSNVLNLTDELALVASKALIVA